MIRWSSASIRTFRRMPRRESQPSSRRREALGRAGASEREGWDPRLSSRGNRVSKQLAVLLDRLAWAENFLECRGWTSLVAADRLVLGPVFARLARDAKCVAEAAGDLAMEMNRA